MITGEKKRLNYLASKLVHNALLRCGNNLISLTKVKFSVVNECFDEDDMAGKLYLQVKIIDYGPKLTKQRQVTILKPLTNLPQEPLDKFNISDIRLISKAIGAKMIVTEKEISFETQSILYLPVSTN